MNKKNYSKTVCLFGGSGFVGETIVQKLAKKNFKLKIATRNPYQAQKLKVYGDAGQIELHKIDLNSYKDIETFLKDADVCINLVGILYETSSQKFDNLHHKFPKKLSEILSKVSPSLLLIHFSALGVKEISGSHYIQSKYAGEQEVKSNFSNCVVIKPSIIVGSKDNFFNMFAKIINILPIVPLVGSETKFQPVCVTDVAEAVDYIICNNIKKSTFELAGNKVYTFKQLIELLLKEIRKKRLIIHVQFSFGKFQAFFFQLLPKPILTIDQVKILEEGDNILSGNEKTLKDLNITPTNIENILPSYLKVYRPKGQFTN